MIPYEQFIRAAAKIKFIETANHGWMLAGLVRWLRPQVVVEVGCFEGGSSVLIARAMQEASPGSMLFCIDDFSLKADSETAFNRNIGRCGVDDRIALLKGKSSEVPWPETVDMAFIDGDHSYAGCASDCDRAFTAGAWCVAIHDTTNWWGPRRWIEEFRASVREGWSVIESYHDSGLAILLNHGIKPPVVYDEETFGSGATHINAPSAEAIR